jgi:hypothetical protein
LFSWYFLILIGIDTVQSRCRLGLLYRAGIWGRTGESQVMTSG